jgi:hypothetical protein
MAVRRPRTSADTVAKPVPDRTPFKLPAPVDVRWVSNAEDVIAGGAPAYDLADFDLAQMVRCGAAVRAMGEGASAMDQVARRLVRHFYDRMRHHGKPACALVRFYKTQAYGDLDGGRQAFAAGVLGGPSPTPEMKCLTLLATVGDEPAWCSVSGSRGHRAIPLPTADFVARIPMISRLVHQFGVDVHQVLRPDPAFLVDIGQQTFNVFHVAEAKGSPYIPAQDFVSAHAIRSVLGFGGMLSNGDLFAIIMFAKMEIPREVAELFRTLTLGVKLAIHPFLAGPTFSGVDA